MKTLLLKHDAFEPDPSASAVTSGSFLSLLASRVYMMSSVCAPFLPQPVPRATGYTKDPSGGEVKGTATNRSTGSGSERE